MLVLTREDRLSSAAQGAVTAARALRNLFAHLSPEATAEALIDGFPWVEVLPEADRAHFARDFVRAFQTSAELGQWSVLAQTLTGWMATAAVHADPAMARELSRPLHDDLGAVPDPSQG